MKSSRPPRNRRKTARVNAKKKSRIKKKKSLSPNGKRQQRQGSWH